jgi:hypothetical protein
MKLKETIPNYNEVIDEFKQLCRDEFSFLGEYDQIDHIPEPESVEIITRYSEKERISTGSCTCVAKIEELIPVHLAKIKEQLLKGKKVYVRIMPEIALKNFSEISLYTRLILI